MASPSPFQSPATTLSDHRPKVIVIVVELGSWPDRSVTVPEVGWKRLTFVDAVVVKITDKCKVDRSAEGVVKLRSHKPGILAVESGNEVVLRHDARAAIILRWCCTR